MIGSNTYLALGGAVFGVIVILVGASLVGSADKKKKKEAQRNKKLQQAHVLPMTTNDLAADYRPARTSRTTNRPASERLNDPLPLTPPVQAHLRTTTTSQSHVPAEEALPQYESPPAYKP